MSRHCLLLALPLALGPLAAMAQDKSSAHHPPATDLSRLLWAPLPAGAARLPVTKLESAGVAALMLSGVQRRGGDALVPREPGDDAAQVAASKGAARRNGQALSIARRDGEPLRFASWKRAATPNGEGDGETYQYVGTLGASGYQRVEVHFEHDAPGSFLVNPQNGAAVFVHTGGDVVSVNRAGNRVLAMNNGLNPPFGLLVAALGPQGHRVELRCQGADTRFQTIIPYFTGWHGAGAGGFDVVLLVAQAGTAGRHEAVPIRFGFKDGQWQIQTSEPERLQAATGFGCVAQ